MILKRSAGPRPVLLVILAAILVIHAVRFAAKELAEAESAVAPDATDFVLDVYMTPGIVEFEANSDPILPLFQVETGEWSFDGDHIPDFAPHVEGLEIDHHGSNPFVVVNLSDRATVDEYRRAIASLADQGICRMGVYSPSSEESLVAAPIRRSDWPPASYASVYKVVTVKSDSGVSEMCRDRFPSWP